MNDCQPVLMHKNGMWLCFTALLASVRDCQLNIAPSKYVLTKDRLWLCYTALLVSGRDSQLEYCVASPTHLVLCVIGQQTTNKHLNKTSV